MENRICLFSFSSKKDTWLHGFESKTKSQEVNNSCWICNCDCDLSNRKVSPEKCFRGFNELRIYGLCVSAAVLHQLTYEDPYVGSRPIY